MATADKTRTLFLVDGTSQLFRAYFAIRGLTNADGLPTNAVFGFTNMLRKLLAEETPEYIAVAFDLSGEVFRHETYAEYKANRPPAPEDLNVQVPYAKQACEALGVKIVELAGYEADDAIATLARRAREKDFDVVVVASDKDLLQLVGDGVTVLNPSKNVRLDADGVRESFGVPPERVRDVLALMGDSVDNVPGVPGVGEKTALAIVSTYGELERVIERAGRVVELFDARDASVEAIDAVLADPAAAGSLGEAVDRLARALGSLRDVESSPEQDQRYEGLEASLSELPSPDTEEKEARKRYRAFKRELKALDKGSQRRIWAAIDEHAEQARMSRELVTLDDRAPVEGEIDGFRYSGPDRNRARVLFGSLGFKGSILAFTEGEEETGQAGGESVEAVKQAPKPEPRYETIRTREALAALAERAGEAGRVSVASATEGGDWRRAVLVGIAISGGNGRAAYVPIAPRDAGAGKRLTQEDVVEELGPLLRDEGIEKIAHDLKHESHVLDRHGLEVRGWTLDTMLAAFLLNSGRSSFSLDGLCEEYLGYAPPTSADRVVGRGAKQLRLDEVDVEEVAMLFAGRAAATVALAKELEPRLSAAGLDELYERVDGPLLPVLGELEATGIRIDTELLGKMSAEMDEALERLRGEIHELAGSEFNVDSPKQLREVLFDRLGLKTRRKTAKSRVASTDAQTLEELATDHPIAGRILEYRELSKLKGTYVDALPRLVDPATGRVHTTFNPTGAATGRLSSSDPNLQNIPARTETGRRIRAGFVPRDGWLFLASDYSQIELRVLAHLAEDPELIEAFRVGEDIHRYTAARIGGVAIELVTDTMRQRAKAVNFGVLYGMSETRLAREQGIPRGEARKFIRAYFERFAAVRAYIDRVRETALRDGAVRTMFGRIRYFPQLHQRVNRAVQEQALRAAVNTTIQGTAADLMKLAMLAVDRELKRRESPARILLQVHDELLIEAPADRIDETAETVRGAMEDVHRLSVPLVVDQKRGESWEDAT